MDELLGGFREVGRHDSPGRFELDLRRAAEKLAHFRLAPGRFVLNLVAAAVKGGASRVDVRTGWLTLELRYDGQSLDAETLVNSFVSTERSRLQRDLAIGLQGARDEGSRIIRLESEQVQARIVKDVMEVREIPGPGPNRIRVTFQIPDPRWSLRTRAVRDDCRFGRVNLNGQPLDGDYPSQRRAAVAGKGFRGWLGLGEGGSLHLVLDGVAFPVRMDYPDVIGVIEVTDLDKDLSQTGLVPNEAYLGVIRGLEEELTRVLSLWLPDQGAEDDLLLYLRRHRAPAGTPAHSAPVFWKGARRASLAEAGALGWSRVCCHHEGILWGDAQALKRQLPELPEVEVREELVAGRVCENVRLPEGDYLVRDPFRLSPGSGEAALREGSRPAVVLPYVNGRLGPYDGPVERLPQGAVVAADRDLHELDVLDALAGCYLKLVAMFRLDRHPGFLPHFLELLRVDQLAAPDSWREARDRVRELRFLPTASAILICPWEAWERPNLVIPGPGGAVRRYQPRA